MSTIEYRVANIGCGLMENSMQKLTRPPNSDLFRATQANLEPRLRPII